MQANTSTAPASGSGPAVLAVNNKLVQFLYSYGKKTFVPKGKVFIKEGEEPTSCYLLLEGKADILKRDQFGQNGIVARIGKGTIVGEMGVFLKEKRSTSVQASTPLILLEFSAARFYKAVENTPELAMRIIRSLAEKLNAANRNSVSARHQQH